MEEQDIKLSKSLTWDEVADEYKKVFGQTALIRPMDDVFDALSKDENFYVDPDKGTIHKILNNQ